MASNKAQLLAAFALALLLMAYSAEADRICTSPSHDYHGRHCNNLTCAKICIHEKFTGGHCERARRAQGQLDDGDGNGYGGGGDLMWRPWRRYRCMCTKRCHEPSPPPDEPPPSELPAGALGVTN